MMKSVCWLTVIVAVVAPNACADNPHNCTSPMRYRDTANGPNFEYTLVIPSAGWVAADTGWCAENHRTAGNNKYDHAHTTACIPFTDDSRTPNVNVTAAMENFYWDAFYTGWTRSGDPTDTHNCHGYAMGQTTPYIVSSSEGSDKFRTDAGYTAIELPQADCIWSTTSHSYKITEIYPCNSGKDRVETRSEKGNESAYYTITYSWPGIGTEDHLYKK